MLKKIFAIGGICAATMSAAQAAPATLVDAASLEWATHCQQELTAAETHSGDFVLTGCPITLAEPVKEWNYMSVDEIVTVADRLASRDMPDWVASWQEGSLAALESHFMDRGIEVSEVVVQRADAGIGADRAAERAFDSLNAANEELPKLQRKELGLVVVLTEPTIAVEYEGEIKNPNPHYEGSNPFKQLGSAMSAHSNGPFVFDGVANIEATQTFYLFDGEGELLDTRKVTAATTTGDIHLSMDDPRPGSFDISATYGQMLDIKKNGRATKPSSDIEDNRYERFKAAFADLGETLAEGVPAAFDDTQRIAEAAGL